MYGFSREGYLKWLSEQTPDDLISRISFDIRNRLSSIIGGAAMLHRDVNVTLTDDDREQSINIIEENANDILNILEAVHEYREIQRKANPDQRF